MGTIQSIHGEIKDAEGNVVGIGGAPVANHVNLLIGVKEPHKWYGMEDSNTGFWLNGKNVPLHGVSRHQDRLDKGWAISKEEAYENTISQMIELVAQNYITDVVSYNHYFGWYGGDVSNNGPWYHQMA